MIVIRRRALNCAPVAIVGGVDANISNGRGAAVVRIAAPPRARGSYRMEAVIGRGSAVLSQQGESRMARSKAVASVLVHCDYP